ncbi:MAG: hypothetical protein J6W37_02605 [Bacteroidales bacterium]|nr:hypothetical protein [Bacteroidales bacterium]
MKRKLLILIILICIVGIIVLVAIFLKKNQVVENQAYNAIPEDAALIVDIPDMSKVMPIVANQENVVWNGFAQFPFVEKGNEFLLRIDSTIKANTVFEDFAHNELLMVVKQIGKNKLDYLYIIPIKKDNDQDIQLFIENVLNLKNESKYSFDKKEEIFTSIDEQTHTSFAYAISKNTLLLSESKVLVETALKGLWENKNIMSNADFTKVKPNDTKVPAKIYFHYDRMAEIFKLSASEEYISRLKDFPQIGSWTELDLSKKNDVVRLNGFVTTDSIHFDGEYFNLFEGQKLVRGNVCSILPVSTSHFIAIGLSNKDKYKENYKNYLRKNSYLNSYEKGLSALNSAFSADMRVNVAEMMYSWIDDEIAFAMMPSFTDNLYDNTFAILKIKSIKTVVSDLEKLQNNYEKKNQGFVASSKMFIAPSGEEYTLYQLPITKIPQTIWGNLFSHVGAKYVTIVDSYVVFANSEQSCVAFINEYDRGMTLASDSNYGRFDDNVKSAYSLYAYYSIPQSLEVFKAFFDANRAGFFDQYAPQLKTMDAISYQIIADEGNKLYNDVVISLSTQKSGKPECDWKMALDTSIISQPVSFVSHRGESLLLFQDGYNVLHLVEESTGKNLWNKQLDGQIMGTINFVDALANNKQQYLFNTAKTVYLLDRNGDNVGNFPLTLQKNASVGIAVFDYDKNKKYRMLIPNDGNTLEMFALEGGLWSKINDWSVPVESPIVTTPRHFVDAGKDYIVFADKYHVYVVNRRGETRIDISELIEKAPNATIAFESGAQPQLSRFITTDVDGVVKEIFLDGTVQSTTLTNVSANHYFLFADVNNDGNGDYIFVDENKVGVYSAGKKVFVYSGNDTFTKPYVFQYDGDTKIAVLDEKNEKLYVINSDGSLYKGFPVTGKNNFYARGKDQCFNVIVEGEQKLLYNYRVR